MYESNKDSKLPKLTKNMPILKRMHLALNAFRTIVEHMDALIAYNLRTEKTPIFPTPEFKPDFSFSSDSVIKELILCLIFDHPRYEDNMALVFDLIVEALSMTDKKIIFYIYVTATAELCNLKLMLQQLNHVEKRNMEGAFS